MSEQGTHGQYAIRHDNQITLALGKMLDDGFVLLNPAQEIVRPTPWQRDIWAKTRWAKRSKM